LVTLAVLAGTAAGCSASRSGRSASGASGGTAGGVTMPSSIGPPPSPAVPSGTGDTLPTGTAAVTAMSTPLGDVLADGRTGRTFYVFTRDGTDRPSCTGACARTWPPVTGSQIGVAAAVTYRPGEFKLVARPGGGPRQLSIGGHPVYLYRGDRLAGQTSGQGAQGTWYVIGTDGRPITRTS
jgi:predicted lipoprotein with Yx(FWY)xxD motif